MLIVTRILAQPAKDMEPLIYDSKNQMFQLMKLNILLINFHQLWYICMLMQYRNETNTTHTQNSGLI